MGLACYTPMLALACLSSVPEVPLLCIQRRYAFLWTYPPAPHLFWFSTLPVSTGFLPTLIVDLGKRVGTEGYPAIFNGVGGYLHFHE